MYSNSGAFAGSARGNDRANLLSGLRQSAPQASVDPQQQAYDLQQAHLELQLRQLQLKNLEMQSALLAQAHAAMGPPQQPQSSYVSTRLDDDRTRRGAMETLGRSQRTRHASANGALSSNELSQPKRGGPRLSFGASEGVSLAEHAIARHSRHQSIEMPMLKTTYETPSQGSSASFRPTLVLSKPGEAFPDLSHQQQQQMQRQAMRGHHKSDSQSSSSSSVSERSSNGSEPVSFDSMTSLGSPQFNGSMVNKLNPSAMTFMPSNGIAPPILTSGTPPPQRSVAPRWVPPVNTALVLAIRQPRGPAREEEMESKNFASRIRRRAIVSLRRSSRPSLSAGQ